MYYTADKKRTNFLGKIAALGQGGSGKTFMINQLANFIAGSELYAWDEEKNIAGTLGITPYTLDFPRGRVVINDNPGQDSLSLVRKAMAYQGDVYQGILIIADAISWNFKDLGLFQAKEILQSNSSKENDNPSNIPITVIVSKRDLRDHLIQPEIIEKLAQKIYSSVNSILDNYVISFFDRAFNKPSEFITNLHNENLIPFTILEQILTNEIDNWLKNDPIYGFTPMNVRLFVRSLLLGYCEVMRKSIDSDKYPEFKSITDPNLLNRLNYHRPTAFETSTGWQKLGGELVEPPILKNTFTVKNIISIMKNFVFASETKVIEFVNVLKNLNGLNSNVVSFTFSDSVTRNGKDTILKTIDKLLQSIENNRENSSSVDKTLKSLGLDEF